MLDKIYINWEKGVKMEKSVKENPIVFRVVIKNSEPVELIEYTKSLMALSSEFISYCKDNNLDMNNEVKLYIKEVKSGSIISDLIAYAPAVFPCIEYANTVMDFQKHLSEIFDYFRGKIKERPSLSQKTLNNIENLMMPAINDNKGSISFDIVKGDKVINNYFISNTDQNLIQNKVRNEKLKILTEDEIIRDVSFYWFQARKSEKNIADKGIIEKVSKQPIKVIMSPEMKKRMISGNLFELTYIVDAKIIMAKGKIVAYNIIDLKEVIDN